MRQKLAELDGAAVPESDVARAVGELSAAVKRLGDDQARAHAIAAADRQQILKSTDAALWRSNVALFLSAQLYALALGAQTARTSVVRRSTTPEWRETFEFNVPDESAVCTLHLRLDGKGGHRSGVDLGQTEIAVRSLLARPAAQHTAYGVTLPPALAVFGCLLKFEVADSRQTFRAACPQF